MKGSGCGCQLPSANNISPKGITSLHSHKMWHCIESIACHSGEISILWMYFHLLMAPVVDIRYQKCTAYLQLFRVVIISIRIILPPVLWLFKWRIEIVPCSCEKACWVIALCGCHLRYFVIHELFCIIAGWSKWIVSRFTKPLSYCRGEEIIVQ
jgi:hypothetical protein